MRWIWLLAVIALLSLSAAGFADCDEGETQECVAVGDCPGTQACSGGEWSDCNVFRVCEPRWKEYCTPVVNGMECPAIKSIHTCSRCGDYWENCEPPAGVECCPGQDRVCDGSGGQECDGDGHWGPCFEGDSCTGVECEDEEPCTEDRCALGECVFVWDTSCCHEDSHCPGHLHCMEDKCVDPGCGECYLVKNHGCVLKKNGICCNGHWNLGYGSCEINYSLIESRVLGAGDEHANYFFEDGVDALEEGFLDQAKQYFSAADLSAMSAKLADDFNSEVLELIYGKLESIDEAIKAYEFSQAQLLSNDTRDLFKLKKPLDVSTAADSNIVLPHSGGEPLEIPWPLVGLLAVVLFVLVIVLLVEKKKIRLPFPYKKEGEEEAAEEGLTE